MMQIQALLPGGDNVSEGDKLQEKHILIWEVKGLGP